MRMKASSSHLFVLLLALVSMVLSLAMFEVPRADEYTSMMSVVVLRRRADIVTVCVDLHVDRCSNTCTMMYSVLFYINALAMGVQIQRVDF